MLGNGGARELLRQQAGEVHDRGARPIASHDVMGLVGVVALDQDHTTELNAAAFFRTKCCTLSGPCPVSVSTSSDVRS